MVIGLLKWVSASEPSRYTRFTEVAGAMGLQVEHPRFGSGSAEDTKRGWSETQRLLRDSDAFILDGLPIEHSPELISSFHRRIDDGARAVVIPQCNDHASLEWYGLFLERYYIRPSWSKLVGPNDERLGLVFRRKDDCLRSPELFSGVSQVVADSPFALQCWGEAWPVLVGSANHWGIEAFTDLPTDWNGREKACMAVWHGHGGGAILVICAYSILTDPITRSPGIETNGTLAKNILRFLSHATPANRIPPPEDLCKRIETNLADFVFGLVRSIGQSWWEDGFPLSIRQKAATRQEDERNRFPKEAYIDLIDLKEIIRANWRIFDPHFGQVGLRGGKEKTLAFMDKLNEIRRLIGHPLKMHVSGYSFSPDERQFLEEVDCLTLKLATHSRK